MSFDLDIVWLGLIAGAITSFGFIPQIIKGYKTKRLEDVSYYMPLVLVVGMFLWLLYGVFRNDLAIIVANIFAVGCNITLIIMKKYYQISDNSDNNDKI
jgi:MtN3 and saliva related transmembrane protein